MNCIDFDETAKIWTKRVPTMQQQCVPKQFGQIILNSLSVHGPKLAQINDDNGVQISYHEMWLSTVRACQNLQRRGVQKHQVFSFMVNHSDHLLPIVLSSLCLACPINALHPLLSKQEIVRVLAITKPSVIFCAIDEYNRIDEVINELKLKVKIFTFDGHIDGVETVEMLLAETGTENRFVPTQVNAENDFAGIFCSSGTTGPSKCAGMSYGLCLPWLTHPNDFLADGTLLCFDSAYWSVGLYAILASVKCGATRIITLKPYSPNLQLKILEKYKVTTLWTGLYQLGVTLKSDQISNANLSSVRQIYSYGSKVAVAADIRRYFPNANIIAWYGMTEIGIICQRSYDDGNDGAGLLVDDLSAKVIDENGMNCGPNTNGELYVKKLYKFPGYFNDPQLSAAAVDNEGFLKTGDIGYFDINGTLFIKDRKKNTILNVFYYRGMIIPAEIQECLITLPDVKDACIVGIPIMGGSELPSALIVKNANSNLSQQDIFKMVADNFPNRYKLRAGVYFVKSIPKTITGKHIRGQAVQLATQMFSTAKENDPIIKSFLSDIPEQFRQLI